MAFVSTSLFETPEQEVARLSAAEPGSRLHQLSQLPVLTPGVIAKGQIFTLPALGRMGDTNTGDNGQPLELTVVIAAVNDRVGQRKELPYKHDASYDCIVVKSNHSSYPVGGYNIVAYEEELRRAHPVTL